MDVIGVVPQLGPGELGFTVIVTISDCCVGVVGVAGGGGGARGVEVVVDEE